MYSVVREIDRAGLSICCVQELRYHATGSELITTDTGVEYELHWSGYERKSEAGVGIVIRRDPGIKVVDVHFPPPGVKARMIAASLDVRGFSVKVISCYAPTDAKNTPDSARDLFYRELSRFTVSENKNQQLMCLGDYNATTGLSLSPAPTFFDGHSVTPDPECRPGSNGERLKTFCRQHQLSMSQTFFRHRRLHRYSWYSNDRKTRKCLDYVLAGQFVQHYMTDCRVQRGFHFDSDHHLLTASLRTPSTLAARRSSRRKSSKSTRQVFAFRSR